MHFFIQIKCYLMGGGIILFFFFSPNFSRLCASPQVPPAAGERPNYRMHSSTVLQRQVQAHPEVSPPPVSTGGAGAEAHLPTSGGKRRLSALRRVPQCTMDLPSEPALFPRVSSPGV